MKTGLFLEKYSRRAKCNRHWLQECEFKYLLFLYVGNTTSEQDAREVVEFCWRCSKLRWTRPEQHHLTGISLCRRLAQITSRGHFQPSLLVFYVSS